MEKLNAYKTQVADVLQSCRTITWDSEVDHTIVQHTVELYTSDKNPLVTELFMGYHGNRVCDCMFLNYVKGAMTSTDFANILKLKLTDKWKHMLGIKLAEYNPLWNVDGTEVHTITTQYGKVTVSVDGETNNTTRDNDITSNTYGKENTSEQITDGHQNVTYDKTNVSEQLENGSQSTTYDKSNTTEQLTDGHQNTTHGESIGTTHGESIGTTHNTTLTDTQTQAGTNTEQLSAFNAELVDNTKNTVDDGTSTHATTGTDTETHSGNDTEVHGGTTSINTSNGKTTDTEEGSNSVSISQGKIKDNLSGADQTSISKGTIKDTEGGSDSTTNTYGEVITTNRGESLEANAGADVVTDKFVRGGNIGVTMTQELLTAENDFWSHFDFFEQWFKDIVKEMSLPFYE